jgi:hypothetical protein
VKGGAKWDLQFADAAQTDFIKISIDYFSPVLYNKTVIVEIDTYLRSF